MITLEDLAGIVKGDRVVVKIVSEQPGEYGVVNPESLGTEIEGEYLGARENHYDKISVCGLVFMLDVMDDDNVINGFHDWLVESVRKADFYEQHEPDENQWQVEGDAGESADD